MQDAAIQELAARIRQAVDDYGVCVLHDSDFETIWKHSSSETSEVKRAHIMNFAAYHGLGVYVNTSVTAAVFHKAKNHG